MQRKINLANLNKLEEEKTRNEMEQILAGNMNPADGDDDQWECSFSAENCSSILDHHGNKNAAGSKEPKVICECGWWIFNSFGMSA